MMRGVAGAMAASSAGVKFSSPTMRQIPVYIDVRDFADQEDALLHLAGRADEVADGFQGVVVSLPLLINLHGFLKTLQHGLAVLGGFDDLLGGVDDALREVRGSETTHWAQAPRAARSRPRERMTILNFITAVLR